MITVWQASVTELEYAENYEGGGGKKKEKSKDSKLSKKVLKSALEAQEESADSAGGLQKLDEGTLKFAVCTGVLSSRQDSKDIKVQSFSISLFGKQLFEDQKLELTYGHRYGLVAQNGSGKTTLLKCIATRQIPIPDFIDIWYLDREAEPSDRTALESVIDTVRNEKERLEKLEEDIMSEVYAHAHAHAHAHTHTCTCAHAHAHAHARTHVHVHVHMHMHKGRTRRPAARGDLRQVSPDPDPDPGPDPDPDPDPDLYPNPNPDPGTLEGHRAPVTHISADEDYAQAVSLDTDGAIFIWDLRTLRPVQELNTRKSIAEACMAGEGSSASRSAASTASAASSSAGGGASDATDHHLQPISALFYDRRGRRVIGGCHHLVEWRSAHKEHHEGARSPRSASPPPHRASPPRPTPLPPSERQQRSMLQRGQKQQQSQPLQPQPSTPSQPFSPPPACSRPFSTTTTSSSSSSSSSSAVAT